jgi:hypothetical protein
MHLMYFTEQPMSAYPAQTGLDFGATALMFSNKYFDPVAGVIVGARLGIAEHLADNARIFDLALDTDDLATIEPVLAKSRDLMRLIGDCGDEYR